MSSSSAKTSSTKGAVGWELVLDLDAMVGNADLIAGPKGRRSVRSPYLHAVGAPQIAKVPDAALEGQAAMRTGDVLKVEADVARLPPADRHDLGDQWDGVPAADRHQLAEMPLDNV